MPAKFLVLSFVDFTHSPFADFLEDSIVQNGLAGSKQHASNINSSLMNMEVEQNPTAIAKRELPFIEFIHSLEVGKNRKGTESRAAVR